VNPGPTLGLTAVIAAYTVVLGALLVFIVVMSRKRKRLERRRKELKQ
jgi:Flp pilus assembly protein TadB